MAKLQLVTGTTSYIGQVFIQDSSSTTGAGLTGLTNASSSLTAYYHRDTDTTATAISLVTMTVGTFTSSGFKEIDATNMPGCYQLCPPNAALAAGAKSVLIMLKGATNMAQLPLEIELTATNNQDAVRGGMTALPNANAEAAGGLYTRGSGAGQITQATNGQIDVDAKKINAVSTSSVTTINANVGTTQPTNFTGTAGSALVKSDMVDVAGSAVSATTAQLGVNVVNWNNTVVASPATAGIPDVNVKNMNNVSAAAITTIKAVQGLTTADTIATYTGNTPQTGDAYARLGAPAGASVSVDVAAVKTDTAAVKVQTDKLTFTVANQVDSNTKSFGGSAGTFASGRPEIDLNSSATTELSSVPASTATLKQMLQWVFLLGRNKYTQTSTTSLIKANDGSTTVGTSTVSDDGTTFTRGVFS